MIILKFLFFVFLFLIAFAFLGGLLLRWKLRKFLNQGGRGSSQHNPFGFGGESMSGSRRHQEDDRKASQKRSRRSGRGKLIGDDEGVYVDFEEIK